MTRPHPDRFGRRLIAFLAALLLVLAACGDDGGGGEALSEADFVAAYNAICLQVDEEISALDPDSFEAAKEASNEAQGIIEDGVAELRALQPPSDITDEVEQGTDSLAATGDVFGELAETEDEAAFSEAAGQIDELRDEAQDVLGPLGIECQVDTEGDAANGDAANGDAANGDAANGDAASSGDGSSGEVPDPEPSSDLADYGSDEELDGLADDCEAGDFDACDMLYGQAPVGSAYEDYGDSCGGRNEAGPFCTTLYDAG